jgi:hypothetical protein
MDMREWFKLRAPREGTIGLGESVSGDTSTVDEEARVIKIGDRVIEKKTTRGGGRREVGEVFSVNSGASFIPTQQSDVVDQDGGPVTTLETPISVQWGVLDSGELDIAYYAEEELEVVR